MHSIDEISRISTRIILKEPFYGHFMLGMPKSMDRSIDTAAVRLLNNKVIQLSINPEFWETLSEDEKYGLIKHELLHVVLKHLFIQIKYGNKPLFNIAADLVVNQYIIQTQLPEGALVLSMFDYLKDLYGIQLEAWQSTDYYYRMLQKAIQQKPSQSLQSYNAENGTNYPSLTDLLNSAEAHQKKHFYWKQFDPLNDADIKVMEYQLYNQIKTLMERFQGNPQLMGHLPGQLIEYLKGFLDSYKPQIDWRRVMKRFAASSTSTYIKNTVRRASKRYGTTPGIKVKRNQKLLIALDTSASVPIKDVEVFFGELNAIWKQGAEVIIVECDADIQKTYPYKGVIPEKVAGRGGTNFTPPISLANKEIRPDGIIYFTDGEGMAPEVKSRCPVLWIITSDGISDEDEWWQELPGQKVKMQDV